MTQAGIPRAQWRGSLGALALSILCLWPLFGRAADYPNRSVRLIVGYTAGGNTDLIARLFAGALKEKLGQSFVVENRPGAAGQIARDVVAKAPPDGYTLLTDVTSLPAYMVFTRNPVIDVQMAFAPISLLTESPGTINARHDAPFNTFQEMVAYAKRNPGRINYSNIGSGVGLMIVESLKLQYELDLVTVEYKGASEAHLALLAGDVHLAGGTLGRVVPESQAGKIKVLVTSGAKRNAALPNVPTAQEVGFKGMYTSWQGLWVPASTPPDTVQTLYKAIASAAATKELRDGLAKLEANVVVSTPEALAERVNREIRDWRAVATAAKLPLR